MRTNSLDTHPTRDKHIFGADGVVCLQEIRRFACLVVVLLREGLALELDMTACVCCHRTHQAVEGETPQCVPVSHGALLITETSKGLHLTVFELVAIEQRKARLHQEEIEGMALEAALTAVALSEPR